MLVPNGTAGISALSEPPVSRLLISRRQLIISQSNDTNVQQPYSPHRMIPDVLPPLGNVE